MRPLLFLHLRSLRVALLIYIALLWSGECGADSTRTTRSSATTTSQRSTATSAERRQTSSEQRTTPASSGSSSRETETSRSKRRERTSSERTGTRLPSVTVSSTEIIKPKNAGDAEATSGQNSKTTASDSRPFNSRNSPTII